MLFNDSFFNNIIKMLALLEGLKNLYVFNLDGPKWAISFFLCINKSYTDKMIKTKQE